MDVLFLSGGQGSYGAGKVLARRGTRPRLLFTDTLIEDEDTYRFLIESAADVLGALTPAIRALAASALALPKLEESPLPDRKGALALLAGQAMAALPGLHWIADGRTPWELFFQEGMIGNTRADLCSRILKRELALAWMQANCNPAETTIHLGIHASERERHNRAQSRWEQDGWKVCSPLLWSPVPGWHEIRAWHEEAGIRRQRLYAEGFAHANCGGMCVKKGQGGFARLLATRPRLYDYHAQQEEAFRAAHGDVAILRDRRGGDTKPFPLTVLRERVQGGGQLDLFDVGGCSCFSGNEEDDR